MAAKTCIGLEFEEMTVEEQEAFMAEQHFNVYARACWRVLSQNCIMMRAYTPHRCFYTWGDEFERLRCNITGAPEEIAEELSDIGHDSIVDGEDEYIAALKDELYRRFCAEANIDT